MVREHPQEIRKKARARLRIRLMVAVPMLLIVTALLTGIILLKIIETELASAHLAAAVVQQLHNYLITAFAFTVLFAAIAGLVLGYTITAPIRKLITSVDKLATGDLSPTVHIDTHAEFDQLGDSFNRMVTSLRGFVHERNKFILESMVGGLLTLDKNGIITTANAAAETMLGKTADELLGKSWLDMLPNVPDNQRLFNLIQSGLEEQKTYSSVELDIFTMQNKRFPIGITTSLLKDSENQPTGLVVTFKDLTKQKQIQQQLYRSDRLAAIGSLATAMAHEIRNPLGSMRALAQLLQEDIQPDDPKWKYTNVIMKETDRLNKIVEELLSFSQGSSGGMELGDFNIIVKEALAIAKEHPPGKPNVRLQQIYDGKIPPLKMEKEKLVQAVLNLIINAFEAVSENGLIEVTTKFAPAAADYPVPNRGFAIFEITNDGTTIPPENYERIFDPFFTTKEHGTGLGLSIAHQIVAAHSGIIQVESVRGESTIFRIRLPIIEETLKK